jgi:hypothetical protein
MRFLLVIAAVMLSGCATSKIIDPANVRTFDDPATRLRCYELIDSSAASHFVCTKMDKP